MLTIYRRLFDLFDSRERRRFWLLCGMILVMGLLEVAGVASVLPFLAVLANPDVVATNPTLSALYDRLGFATIHQFLIFLGAATFCVIFFGQLFKSVTVYALSRFSKMREYSLGSRLLVGYLRQPYAWFLHRHSADLGKTVLSEVQQVTNSVVVPALRLLAYGTVAVLLVIFLFVISPLAATGGALIVSCGYGASFVMTRRYLNRTGAARVRANTERFQLAHEALGGIKDIKLLGLEDRYMRRFQQPARRFAHFQAMAMAIAEVPRFVLEGLVFGAMMAFLLTLLWAAEGQLEQVLPIVGMFALAGARIFPALQHIYRSASNLRFNRAAIAALHADMRLRDTAAPVVLAAAVGAPLRLRERLELDEVRFTYDGAEKPALAGLSLGIDANTTVGLVGTSGAGKTTAVDVMLGLLRPQVGVVRVDGVALDDANLRAWQRTIGYVPQQIFLTDDTVAANIALGLEPEEIDMAAVERAAALAELHHFVTTEMPRGYATQVGERGVRLSGGQRQRIGIARALYYDPDVLILDEATSALDNLTERAVMDAVHNLARAKTIVLIAHRLSTVRHCDAIHVLENGRCTAVADYDTLMACHPAFRQLAAAAM